jgi:hypothetical protein
MLDISKFSTMYIVSYYESVDLKKSLLLRFKIRHEEFPVRECGGGGGLPAEI